MKGLALFFVPVSLALMMSCTNSPTPTATPPPPTLTFTLSPTQAPTPTSSPTPSLAATLTPVPPTFTPTPEMVTVELSEAELAESYQAWLEEAGLSVETVEVKLAGEKFKVSMKKVGIPVYMVEEFEMLGTCTVLDGRLKFQLEEVAPDAPWVWVIAPMTDDIMAGITEGIHVTGVEIDTGRMLIKGLKLPS